MKDECTSEQLIAAVDRLGARLASTVNEWLDEEERADVLPLPTQNSLPAGALLAVAELIAARLGQMYGDDNAVTLIRAARDVCVTRCALTPPAPVTKADA